MNLAAHTRLIAMALLASTAAPAQEPVSSMQSAAERALEIPSGAWQGQWLITRDDERIRTRASAEALRLSIVHNRGGRTADLRWSAGRAICDDPLDQPCEWVGNQGVASRVRVIEDGALLAVLPISADDDDHFILFLSSTRENAAGLLYTRDLSYRVEVQSDR